MHSILARQVHLDFHTSELIPGVGSRFDRRQFQDALQAGHVNWINLFAKCHHGWSYYPTTVGAIHPALTFDLLGQQIDACHEIGVRAPIYYTVGWSVRDAETHPEWCVRKADETIHALNWDPNAKPSDRRPPVSWQFLCPSGGYLDLILRQTEELCRRYPVDGLWYDITGGPPCYCTGCRAGLAAEGIDLADDEAVADYNVRKWQHFMAECRRVLFDHFPEATVFFNGTTILHMDARWRSARSRLFDGNTQQELEDLPTTWGGYDKLPLRAKFFHNTGNPLVAMSGKFHTSWGEFGGFKHPDALRYEAASMIAFGVACNFGDQLHPAGEMDPETYRHIGAAFDYVEQIEEYGLGGVPESTLGLWFSGAQADDEGVSVMLLETQTDFAVVDPEGDLSVYETIILPGAPSLTAAEAARLTTYVAGGGRLLVLGAGALDPKADCFLLDVGADYLGPAQFDEDYLVVSAALGSGLVSTPFLNYEAALRVTPHPGSEVLATLREPYFNRTYAGYCSHQNTPYRLETAPHPGALRAGNVLFLPHRLGRLYHLHGARLHRDLFCSALRMLHERPLVRTQLPSAGRVSLLHQPQHHRYVVHLLYAPPIQRGRCLVIEDLPPLYDVPVEVHLPQPVLNVNLIPGPGPAAVEGSGGNVRLTVPELKGHRAVVFEYGRS